MNNYEYSFSIWEPKREQKYLLIHFKEEVGALLGFINDEVADGFAKDIIGEIDKVLGNTFNYGEFNGNGYGVKSLLSLQ